MNQAIKYYNQLPANDKKALIVLGAIMAILFLFFALIQPSKNFYSENKSLYLENRELVTWIELNKGKIPSTNNSPSGKTQDDAIIQTVSASADKHKIKLSRLQPEGKTKVRIWVNNGNFNALMSWFSVLSDNTGIKISSISIDNTDKPGTVNVQCLFTQN